jgi:hypothetical protein
MLNSSTISPAAYHNMIELYSALLEIEENVYQKRKALSSKLEKDWEKLPQEARKAVHATLADLAKEAKLLPDAKLSLQSLATRLQ